jgi:hypothetical protein
MVADGDFTESLVVEVLLEAAKRLGFSEKEASLICVPP